MRERLAHRRDGAGAAREHREAERRILKGKSKYPKLRVITYLLYHFPVYFCQFQYLSCDLLKGGFLTTK